MARMPQALWKPLPNPSKSLMARYDLVVIHTMVGSLAGTDGYFRKLTNGVNSHFGTGGYGELWQWVDTARRSGANGAGNHRAITVENADMGPGFAAWDARSAANVPAFTAAQIETNAQVCAWAHLVHKVPLVQVDTSRPNVRGVGYHKLGCDPYRVADGEKWSSSYGKVCPSTRRIAQIPQIITRARQIVAGAPVAPSDPLEEIMAWYKDRDEFEAAMNRTVLCRTPSDRTGAWLWDRLVGIDDKTGATGAGVAQLLASGGSDATAIAEALRPILVEAVQAGRASDSKVTADQIVDELTERLVSSRPTQQ